MATPDTRDAYELLWRALQQKYLPQRADDFDTPPGYGRNNDGTQQGLLGRLRALESEASQQQPSLQDSEETAPKLLGPNFRQLSRSPLVRVPPIGANTSLQSNDRSIPSSNMVESGTSYEIDGSPQSGTYSTPPALPWIVPSSASTTGPLGWRVRGIPVPLPPMAPVSLPPISMPAVPDWWREAAKILQILPRGMYGDNSSGSGGRDAYNQCIDAAEGGVEDWNNFCRFLDRGQLGVAGGGKQSRACWSKAYESETQKKNWCENQFGGR